MAYNNVKYHAVIRNWDTEQLINALHLNGLSDCCDAVQKLQIDGEAFLNLSEGQLTFWRKYLNNVQVKRFWSIIQLALERPKDFISDIEKISISTHNHEIERIRSPIVHSLENILGQKTTGNINVNVSNNVQDETSYENNETIKQITTKISYNNLPPKPVKQEQIESPQENKRHAPPKQFLPMKQAEPEKVISQNKFIPISVQPILQNPEIKIPIQEETKLNSFLHSSPRVVRPPNVVESSSNSHRRVPSPNSYSRPLPTPPKNENALPLPPNVVPLIMLPRPPLQSNLPELIDEEPPIYDDVVLDDYKMKPWYSDIDRKKAIQLLTGKPNGTFVARPSKRVDSECCLSISYEHHIYNLAIVKRGNLLVIGEEEFHSVNEIIECFIQNELVINGVNNEDICVTLRQI